MTKEEKQILLKDLCPRLPYFTIAYVTYKEGSKTMEGNHLVTTDDIDMLYESDEVIEEAHYTIKPYLRPLSSMTEEEENELVKIAVIGGYNDDSVFNSYIITDWLNAHHFDYRGLIPMGLALEAPKDMYKTESLWK